MYACVDFASRSSACITSRRIILLHLLQLGQLCIATIIAV
jgi:hypothetical protein